MSGFARRTAAVVVAAVAAALGAYGGTATAQPTAPGPSLRLVAAQRDITVAEVPGQPVSLDPGIWVESLGTDFRLNVRRPSLAAPMSVTQIIQTSSGTRENRPLPSAVLDGWAGLAGFLHVTITNSHGKSVASSDITFCPNSGDPQRATPESPVTSPYPQLCGTLDPFELATAWGIERGWATDPAQSSSWPAYTLVPGRYRVTASITPGYLRLFGIPARDGTATVTVTVVKGSSAGSFRAGSQPKPASAPELPRSVPDLPHPPASALPDLIAQPAWEINTTNTGGRDLLTFAATVWVAGNAPLDVEGFRVSGSPVMTAYQYFWRNGHVIGRASAGTMSFDSQHGHNHWHFQQFAAYQLVNASQGLVMRSQKVGFCIAATDSIDLLLPHSLWQPSSIGLGGQCGVPSALWVQEYLPVGWGDTYTQAVAGQAFDITDLPNGTYYIEVIANPDHVLRELTTANDISRREVILGGSRGNRTACVPAVDGVDPEC